MNYGDAIYNSYEYAKSSVTESIPRWFVLAAGIIIFPIIIGYLLRIAKGAKEEVSLHNFRNLFVQGIIGFIIVFVYIFIAIIAIAIIAIIFGGIFAVSLIGITGMDQSFLTGGWSAYGSIAALYGLIFLMYGIGIPVFFAYNIICITAFFRYARTSRIGEAFNFSAISSHIQSIGWFNFLLGLCGFQFVEIIVMYIIFGLCCLIMSPFLMGGLMTTIIICIILGFLLLLFFVPFEIFTIKFYSYLYDSGSSEIIE